MATAAFSRSTYCLKLNLAGFCLLPLLPEKRRNGLCFQGKKDLIIMVFSGASLMLPVEAGLCVDMNAKCLRQSKRAMLFHISWQVIFLFLAHSLHYFYWFFNEMTAWGVGISMQSGQLTYSSHLETQVFCWFHRQSACSKFLLSSHFNFHTWRCIHTPATSATSASQWHWSLKSLQQAQGLSASKYTVTDWLFHVWKRQAHNMEF